ncbi:hypothetical protein HYH03_014763 [Edaphochlamys debaryana]|uniref:Uncharacterized protein n=1 Tax=Edaphochlamys debaryana TaxID=47281 RepID=A0A835XPI7_9CHLO|nr:hypothetical protein HYH03_014763 [Edaphochlamys debaryana]|eukprot:KAG2486593.1 hypothetical protein HYH03_014763 [Edaphochlamys debaryana]
MNLTRRALSRYGEAFQVGRWHSALRELSSARNGAGAVAEEALVADVSPSRRRSRRLEAPSRDTWFGLYQREPGKVAYLFEHDAPITQQVFTSNVAPALERHWGRPARLSYIASREGETFFRADHVAPPWYSYRVRLTGVRVGQPYGPYEADDLVSPNRVELPLQGRARNNVRDAQAVMDLMADPRPERLAASLRSLVRVAHEDRWHGGPALVHRLMGERWGPRALAEAGLSPAAVARACAAHSARMAALEAGEEGAEEAGEEGREAGKAEGKEEEGTRAKGALERRSHRGGRGRRAGRAGAAGRVPAEAEAAAAGSAGGSGAG